MQKGNIGVTSDNIFPIIKKFLYSDQEIFLRELISNAVDATQKLKTLSSFGDFKGELEELTVNVAIDSDKKTLTISDHGVGMTAEEIDKYINQIAFSGAEEFLEKYKNQDNAIIGHFGLGFYSAFMVAKKVEIKTLSYQEGAKAVKWTCDGSPEYTVEEIDKKNPVTEITLHIYKESEEFLQEARISELLNKYCRFLPVEIGFGEEKEYKDDKMVSTGKPKIINNTNPLWTQAPQDIKEEDYKKFYRDLYPMGDEPLFNIHINVDYPFNLTGILYFPKIRNNIEVQKNKIQLYCNQVYVTDSVEGIVPEFLTLLHGVLDSPDIPLNVSRSYLQSDSNVKKISSHITKKVADRLNDLFKNDRKELEEKWDDLKLFIEYGMLTEDKFYEKAEKFFLLKNTEGKYFTFKEYEKLIKDAQTDKHKNKVHLYATDKDAQYTYINEARDKGYDVLMFDGQFDIHFINHIEPKLSNVTFKRVDADIVEKLIEREDEIKSTFTEEQENNMRHVFLGTLPKEKNFGVIFEGLKEDDLPMIITQSEFMRRMLDMSKLGGNPMGFGGDLPESYNLIINTNHKLVNDVLSNVDSKLGEKINEFNSKVNPLKEEKEKLEKENEKKKEEEVSQESKDKLEQLRKDIDAVVEEKKKELKEFGKKNKLVKQMIDLALLSNNMLRGEDLARFVKRSVDLIK